MKLIDQASSLITLSNYIKFNIQQNQLALTTGSPTANDWILQMNKHK